MDSAREHAVSGSNSGVMWRKSSWCNAYGTCVEVAELPGGQVGMRDGKDPAGPVLRFDPAQWQGFVAAIRAGTF
jgi:Domain of unknown function (DUF397)